jgi:hypothetical protein
LFSAAAGPVFLKMPVLTSSKHEKFAQLVATGVSATEAYGSAGVLKGERGPERFPFDNK